MADTISRDFINTLLNRIDIVDLINQYFSLTKKSGNNYFACCPFHTEKTASFSVSQQKQFYHCFGCAAHGNAIDFVMQYEHLTFPEVITKLAQIVGLPVPRGGQFAKDEKNADLFSLTERIREYYCENLKHHKEAQAYLNRRGISESIIKDFKIGVSLPSWDMILKKFGKNKKEQQHLIEVGLIVSSNNKMYDRFRNRIMFPIHDYRGRVIGFGGRIIEDGEPKYLNSPETTLFHKGHELYGLYEAKKTNRDLKQILIVEGYMDVISLAQYGITNSVATLGTATTPGQIKKLFQNTDHMIFCFDGDTAGISAAWRALLVLLPIFKEGKGASFLFLPEGEDPDSMVRKEGKDKFAARIKDALSLSEFLFQHLGKEVDFTKPEGRAKFANHALQHIKQLPEGLYRNVLLDELSKRTRILNEKLQKELLSNSSLKDGVKEAQKGMEQKNRFPLPVKLALSLLVQNPNFLSHLEPQILDYFGNLGPFYQKLIKTIQENSISTTGILREFFRGEKEESFITKLANIPQTAPEAGLLNEFLGTQHQLKILIIEEKIENLMQKVKTLSIEEKEHLNHLILEKKEVSSLLSS